MLRLRDNDDSYIAKILRDEENPDECYPNATDLNDVGSLL